jgi:hypothetical protein
MKRNADGFNQPDWCPEHNKGYELPNGDVVKWGGENGCPQVKIVYP